MSGTNISTEGITRMTEMRDGGAVAFIGPDLNCTNEALVAAAWNLPMIAYVSRHVCFSFFLLTLSTKISFTANLWLFPLYL